jgi:hypothetical protein
MLVIIILIESNDTLAHILLYVNPPPHKPPTSLHLYREGINTYGYLLGTVRKQGKILSEGIICKFVPRPYPRCPQSMPW